MVRSGLSPGAVSRLSPAERRLGFFSLACSLLFFAAALLALVAPNLAASLLGLGGSGALVPAAPLLEPNSRALWVGANMGMAVCALMAGLDPRGNRPFLLPVMAIQGGAVLEALADLLRWGDWGAVTGVMAWMGPLLVVTAFLTWRALKSVNGSLFHGTSLIH